jgi:hypothetical protein
LILESKTKACQSLRYLLAPLLSIEFFCKLFFKNIPKNFIRKCCSLSETPSQIDIVSEAQSFLILKDNISKLIPDHIVFNLFSSERHAPLKHILQLEVE